MVSLRDVLKSETRQAHEQLDQLIMMLDPFSSLESYQHYLSGMWVSYARFSESLDWVSIQVGLPTMSRVVLRRLAIDLQWSTPSPPEPMMASEAKRWGHAYVLEGASLGARMLFKQAQQQLGENAPKNFLEGAVEDSQGRWPGLVNALHNIQVDQDVVIGGAIEAFEFVTQVFRDGNVEVETRNES